MSGIRHSIRSFMDSYLRGRSSRSEQQAPAGEVGGSAGTGPAAGEQQQEPLSQSLGATVNLDASLKPWADAAQVAEPGSPKAASLPFPGDPVRQPLDRRPEPAQNGPDATPDLPGAPSGESPEPPLHPGLKDAALKKLAALRSQRQLTRLTSARRPGTAPEGGQAAAAAAAAGVEPRGRPGTALPGSSSRPRVLVGSPESGSPSHKTFSPSRAAAEANQAAFEALQASSKLDNRLAKLKAIQAEEKQQQFLLHRRQQSDLEVLAATDPHALPSAESSPTGKAGAAASAGASPKAAARPSGLSGLRQRSLFSRNSRPAPVRVGSVGQKPGAAENPAPGPADDPDKPVLFNQALLSPAVSTARKASPSCWHAELLLTDPSVSYTPCLKMSPLSPVAKRGSGSRQGTSPGLPSKSTEPVIARVSHTVNCLAHPAPSFSPS